MGNILHYATSLIKDNNKIVGAHVVSIVIPDVAWKSRDEIEMKSSDVYNLPQLNMVENLEIKNGNITTIHGASSNYNTIQINAFGHLIPLEDKGYVVLFKIGDKYLCIDIQDRMMAMTPENMLMMENKGRNFCNIAIETQSLTVRPLASAGKTHQIRYLEVKQFDASVKELNHKMLHWINSPTKAVLFDIDGTITDKDGKVPQEMVNKLIQLNSIHGVYVILATGRILEHELSKSIQSNLVALGNGSIMFKDGKLVASKLLNPEMAMRVTEYARSKGLACQTYDAEERLIIQRKNNYQHDDPEAKNKNNRIVYVDRHTMKECSATPKVLIAVSPDLVQSTKEDVERVVDLNRCNVMITTKTTVEVVPKGVDKQLALTAICRILRITPDEVITVGDNNNDIPMLANSGISFAVKNATTEVKQVVTKVTVKPMWEGSIELVNSIIKAIKVRTERYQKAV